MKKQQHKPTIGSSKQELMDYINVLENTVRQLNKRKESIETVTKMTHVVIDLAERVAKLESRFNTMTDDVDGWRRDYGLKDFE